MGNGSENEKSGKSGKKKILIGALIAVLLICAAFGIMYAAGVFDGGGKVAEDGQGGGSKNKDADKAKTEAKNRADAEAVTDEATLRRLLAAEGQLDINVAGDIEITEAVLTVNGQKSVKGGHTLTASYDLGEKDFMLEVTPKSSLTVDGINLKGNMIAGGVSVEKDGSLTVNSGRIDYTGVAAVQTAGEAKLLSGTGISHVGGSALRVTDYGKAEINGGTYEDSGNILIGVEEGGSLVIEGDPVFDGARTCLLSNYGDTKIYGGSFKNSAYRGILSRRRLTMDYRGAKRGGMIEIYNTNYRGLESLGASTFECKDVYVHKINGGWGFDGRNNIHRVRMSNCIFDGEGAGGAEIGVIARGDVVMEDITVRNAKACGIKLEEKGSVVKLNDILIEKCSGDVIRCEGVTMIGNDITIGRLDDGASRAIRVGNNEGLGKERKAKTYVEITGLNVRDGGNRGVITTGEDVEMKLIDSYIGVSDLYSVCAEKKSKMTLRGVNVSPVISSERAALHADTQGNIVLEKGTKISGSQHPVGVYNGSTLTMNGGSISGNRTEGTFRVVQVTTGSTFIMNGGSISDNVVQPGGFVVRTESAGGKAGRNVFIMNGGSICDNTGADQGGAVALNRNGVFTMSGGEIYGNHAGNAGGGVYVTHDSTFTMTGGSIHDNEAVNSAGAVYVGGRMDLKGGRINDNVCGTYGAGINVDGNKTYKGSGTLNMTGGVISGNTARKVGGAMIVSDADSTANLRGGEIYGNVAENEGKGSWENGVLVQGTVNIGGTFHLGSDNRVFLRGSRIGTENVRIHVEGRSLKNHDESDPLLVQTDRNIGPGKAIVECDNASYASALLNGSVKYGNAAYDLISKDGDINLYTDDVMPSLEDMKNENAPRVKVSKFQELKQAVEGTASELNVVVDDDITFEDIINVPEGVTVCVTDDGQERNFIRKPGMKKNFFDVPYGSGLKLEATEDGRILFDGEQEPSPLSFIKTKGHLQASGVTFQKNHSTDYGGAIWCYGDLTLDDCEFLDNSVGVEGGAAKNGGAIALWEKDRKVTITNSTFTNNVTNTNCGGAIFNRGSDLTIKTCEFNENKSTNQGGAIYQNTENDGSGDIVIEDSFFKGNIANTKGVGSGGGAISVLGGTLKVTDTGFEANTCAPTTGGGGAVSVSTNKKVTLSGCVFGKENDASAANSSSSNGGAIYSSSVLELKDNCKFYGNTSGTYGGAIRADGDLTVSDSTFKGNQCASVGGAHGGAIALYGGSKKTVKVESSTFTENKSPKNNGGAIFNCSADLTLTGCTFDTNSALSGGGAIYQSGEKSLDPSTVIAESHFTSNTVENGSGGAVFVNAATLQVTDTEFDGNSASSNGGAVSIICGSSQEGTDYTYPTVTFEGSTEDAVFTGNLAKGANGGAIYTTAKVKKVSVSGYTFDGNKVLKEKMSGGAVFATGVGTAEQPLIFTDCTFTANTAPGNGGALCLNDGGSHSVISGSTFGEDGADGKANSSTAQNGGAIYAAGELKVKDGSAFYGNKAATYGGAIRADGALTVTDTTFAGNKSGQNSGSQGGAIALYGNAKKAVTVKDSTFTGNEGPDGGAIFNCHADLTVTSCTFESNKSTKRGGAIYQSGERNVAVSTTVKGSHFVKNTVVTEAAEDSGGGAVFVNTGALNVTDTEFKNNTAGGVGGGAVAAICGKDKSGNEYAQPSVTFDGTAENAVFTGNSATAGNGGAVYTTEKVTKFSISGYTFDGNKVTTTDKNGGAVYASGVGTADNPLKITNSVFTANTAPNNGGALCLDYGKSHAVISGSTFGKDGDEASANSTTVKNGGAIYAAGELEVKDGSAFYGNKSATYGGAIRADGVLTVTDTTFAGNKSGSGHGGALALYGSAKKPVTVEKSIFTENKSLKNDGGAIFNCHADLTVTSSKFDRNESQTQGGAIYQSDEKKLGLSTIVKDSVFTDNKNTSDGNGGGAIMIRSGDLQVTDTAFQGNVTPSTKKGGGSVSVLKDANQPAPATITFTAAKDKIQISDEEYAVGFRNNKATANVGGALYVEAANEFTVTGYTFEGNTAKGNGGAVNCTGGVKKAVFSGCTFGADGDEDKANISSDKSGNGGAICATGELEVKDGCKFYGNKAGGYGGAIRADGVLAVNGATFTDNHGGMTSGHGGAIALYRAQNSDRVAVKIESSTFTRNQSEKSNGGAIFNGGNQDLTITGCTFDGNEANNAGAVLQKEERGTATLTISDSKFMNNKARTGNGGAISSDTKTGDDPVKVNGCTFTSNTAKGNGGAIYAHKLTLGGTGGSFKGNSATKGKAIAINAASTSGWLTGQGTYSLESGQDIAYLK